MKPSCLKGDNHTIEICRCRIEQFDRFIKGFDPYVGNQKFMPLLIESSELPGDTNVNIFLSAAVIHGYSRTLKTQHLHYRFLLSEYRMFPKNIC